MKEEKANFCDLCSLPLVVAGVLHLWPDGKWLCSACQEIRSLKEDEDDVRFMVLSSY